jgi:hypothetical protein
VIGRRDWIPDSAVKRLAVLTFLTALVVALIGFLEPVASASPVQHPQSRVAAIEHATTQLVGPHEIVLPGGSRSRAPNYDSPATGSSVAAEEGAASDEALTPFSENNLEHIFREAPGHLADDTTENRLLLQNAVNPDNYVSTNAVSGVSTYRQLLPNGEQVWVEVRNGVITNGGVNQVPR